MTSWLVKAIDLRLAQRVLQVACLVMLGTVPGWAQPESVSSSETEDGVEFFEQQVRPILEAKCWSCHGPEKQRGGLRLDHPELLKKGGDLGPAVSLETPADSQLLRAINYEDLEMPPSGKLNAEQIAVLTKWVELGVPWTPGVAIVEAHEEDQSAAVEATDHWAYQPLQPVAVPQVMQQNWVRNPIDAFLLARLELDGMTPNPPASHRTLLRRLYYDLLGLPPTKEELERFESQSSIDAYDRLVDELLARPEYGEKWGRHWLDLVRYAETNGYERDGNKPNAWRYRDYVVRSFNEGKPYDRFVLEQLAGDELPDRSHDSLIATGYHRLGIWDDEPADPDQAFYDSLDDVLSTTTTVFLATTVGCARCHDHKIDPIPQRDYYSMLAFFHNTYNNIQQLEFKKSAFSLNTQRPIATDAELIEHRARRELHRAELEQVTRELAELEEKVVATLSNAEREDARDERVRRYLIEQRVESVLEPQQLERYRWLNDELKQLKTRDVPPLPQALAIAENGRNAPPTHVLVRGNAHAPGDPVEPGFLSVLGDLVPSPSLDPAPEGIQSSGRRLAFAEWMVSENHPLTARVIVNRVWQHHFGRGLVRSTSDFGKAGDVPTHPELLDYLATELIRRGWDLKWLHQSILRSQAYRMSSADDRDNLQKDPLNDRFWRMDMRRLTAEEVRDTLLLVTGQLNREMGGPSVYTKIPDSVLQTASRPDAAWGHSTDAERARRTVYTFVKRSINDPLMVSFDAADKDSSCPVRFATTVPTQSLTTLNGALFHEHAELLAERVRQQCGNDLRGQTRGALEITLGRGATDQEVDRGVELLESWQKQDGASPERSLHYFCLLCLNLNEFVYLD
jgi:cytochrome c553